MPENHPTVPWTSYLSTTFLTVGAFYLATLSFAIFITHHGDAWLFWGIVMGLLYLSVIGMCVAHIIRRFSMAALMIVIPIAPLLALFSVVSLIPLLERLG